MQKPKKIVRTNLGSYLSNPEYSGAGVYVVACYPSLGCLYIGISDDVQSRLRQHTVEDKPFSAFLRNTMADAYGFRLDVLVPPDGSDVREWCIQAERDLVQTLRPTYNTQHLGA